MHNEVLRKTRLLDYMRYHKELTGEQREKVKMRFRRNQSAA